MHWIYTFFIIIILSTNTKAHTFEYRLSVQPDIILSSPDSLEGQSIAWNLNDFVYYTTSRLDSTTVINVFDQDGQHAHQQVFPFVINGIWYNSTLDFLEAYNQHSNTCFSFFIDENGFFENQDTLHRVADVQESTNKSHTIFNQFKDVYAYVEPVTGMIIEVESHTGEIDNYIQVDFPVDKKILNFKYFYYTDLESSPYLFVNTSDKILLFVDEEGQISKSVEMPSLDFEPKSYGYTNGMLWVFDSSDRNWLGFSLH